MSWLSVIVPALDEADNLRRWRNTYGALMQRAEMVLVDGGSTDDTAVLARRCFHTVLEGQRGRARQMNAGASIAAGEWLLFLHADTQFTTEHLEALWHEVARTPECWGRFDVRMSSRHPLLRLVARMMNWRSAWTGIATGDQCIFVRADIFARVGGFPDQPLMEDIVLSRRLRRHGRPLCIRTPVTTDSRRWERHGIVRTIVLMWLLRLGYFLGVSPRTLAGWYAAR